MGKEDKSVRQSADLGRRRVLQATGAGAVATMVGIIPENSSASASPRENMALRWGVVGTGGIANRMAPMIQMAPSATLSAVSSRRMDTAREFAEQHSVEHAFDSWEDMIASDTVDAIYVATPTFIREEICLAAANHGKHVLGEKPFADLASLQRITAACRLNNVAFMDGTNFVHHPRPAFIRAHIEEHVGNPWSVASAFQFNLTDTSNIRMNPDLEPYGAIGDAGWYNMRVAVEYLPDDIEIAAVSAYLRREEVNGAVVTASGVIQFDNGSTTTWNCGFESGSLVMDLRISGSGGIVKMDDFLVNLTEPARHEHIVGWGDDRVQIIETAAPLPAAAQMYENVAAMSGSPDLFEASVRASERTQEWLDAIWVSAVANEA